MIRLPHLLTFLLLLCWSFEGWSQQYNFRRYSIEEGLPRSGVYAVFEDDDGFLWIGTEGGGMSMFNGLEFKTYTTGDGLAHNVVRTVFQDADGNMWFGTEGGGLSRFDGENFTTYDVDDGLGANHVRTIAQDDKGMLWIGTFGGGVCRCNPKKDPLTFECFTETEGLAHHRVRASLVDSKGNIWFGTDGGISKYNGRAFRNYTTESGLPHKRILCIFEDGLKNLWFGTPAGAVEYNGSNFNVFDETNGLINKRVRAIAQDNVGNLWFGTQVGVSQLSGGTFQHFTEKEGLSDGRIRDILKDYSGNLWFGTHFGGINKFSGDDFIHFSEKDGLRNNQIHAVFSRDGEETWLGTANGISILKFDFNQLLEIKNPDIPALNNREVHDIQAGSSNDLWLATDDGIIIYQNEKTKRLGMENGLVSDEVNVISMDSSEIWIGCTGGLSTMMWRDGEIAAITNYTKTGGLPGNEISTILKDSRGNRWIGFSDNSLLVHNGEYFADVEIPENLRNVSTIKEDKHGNIWISTEGFGLFKYANEADSLFDLTQAQNFSIQSGLHSNNIYGLVFDDDQNLWLALGNGADKISMDENGKVTDIRHFGRNDGFMGIENNRNATCRDDFGNLWFGTVKGATRFNPYARSINKAESRTHLTNLQLFYEEVDWENSEFASGTTDRFKLPKNLRLPHHQNHLTFDFIGINLKSPQNVKYQWRLKGWEKEWSEPGEKSSINYTNLPHGNYTFMVKSSNDDGIWNKQPETFSFTILKPFWLEWWFIAVCSFIAVVIIWLYIKYRERKLIKEREVLEQKVEERTEEVVQEKKKSDALLLNILPYETAEELKQNGKASVKHYKQVSVLFTDFVGFTRITEKLSHEKLVNELDAHFKRFDEIMEKYAIEKIKTIGDAYMCAGGIPVETRNNAIRTVLAGLEIQQAVSELNREKSARKENPWQLRLGIHTGPLIAGVVGKKKFAYDIWGDTVNTASRIESSGEPGKVNISGATYELIKDYFICRHRGKLPAKNKGEIDMYFVEKIKGEFAKDGNGLVPDADLLKVVES